MIQDKVVEHSGPEKDCIGNIKHDSNHSINDRVGVVSDESKRHFLLRNQFVVIESTVQKVQHHYLGRVVSGPFVCNTSADPEGGQIEAQLEILGQLLDGCLIETYDRPVPGSQVFSQRSEEIRSLLRCDGDMNLGTLAGRPDVPVCLRSQSKDVLPRNLGIFGTVGSGKSNTMQVIVEEASRLGWAVILLDVEGEYIEMDRASPNSSNNESYLPDFKVLHPSSCASERSDSHPFTLRLADFEGLVISELLHVSHSEQNALIDSVEYFLQKYHGKMPTSSVEGSSYLAQGLRNDQLPYTLLELHRRVSERSARSTDFFDYLGLATKLSWLMHGGAFEQKNVPGLDPAQLVVAGRVTILDVSVANDTVKNLVTADMLRKIFAYKLTQTKTPPTLLVIEEAHSFISREKVNTMQATLQMLQNVTRRGRKRWLATAFVSQQPGHLPSEIFELCNTRIVHTLNSMQNLEALMATTSDISRELWERCPMFKTGEAILSTPQLKRPVVMNVRLANSFRKFMT